MVGKQSTRLCVEYWRGTMTSHADLQFWGQGDLAMMPEYKILLGDGVLKARIHDVKRDAQSILLPYPTKLGSLSLARWVHFSYTGRYISLRLVAPRKRWKDNLNGSELYHARRPGNVSEIPPSI